MSRVFDRTWPDANFRTGTVSRVHKSTKGTDIEKVWSVAVPVEVDGGAGAVLGVGRRGVAVRERAEEGVGEQTGDLDLRQSDGLRLSSSQQGDGLETQSPSSLSSSSSPG